MKHRLVLVPFAAVLLLAGCSAGEEDDPTLAIPSAAATAAEPSSAASAAAPSAVPTPSVRTIAVTVSGGAVTGTSVPSRVTRWFTGPASGASGPLAGKMAASPAARSASTEA